MTPDEFQREAREEHQCGFSRSGNWLLQKRHADGSSSPFELVQIEIDHHQVWVDPELLGDPDYERTVLDFVKRYSGTTHDTST